MTDSIVRYREPGLCFIDQLYFNLSPNFILDFSAVFLGLYDDDCSSLSPNKLLRHLKNSSIYKVRRNYTEAENIYKLIISEGE